MKRRGFTLVELLVVIVIISILIALVFPAIASVRRRVNVARVKTDIVGLETGLTAFKGLYGDYPPSQFALYKTTQGWASAGAAPFRSALRTMFPQMAFDYPDAGMYPASWDSADTETDGNGYEYIRLSASECLVFFLGGLVESVGGVNVCTGFSKSPQYPFRPKAVEDTTSTRNDPLFDFQNHRLRDVDNDGMMEYFDMLSDQAAPYLYLSSYGGTGYRAIDLTGTTLADVYRDAAVTATPGVGTVGFAAYEPRKYQIISPGVDGLYGLGGVFNDDLPAAGLQDRADHDNITNFHGGELLP